MYFSKYVFRPAEKTLRSPSDIISCSVLRNLVVNQVEGHSHTHQTCGFPGDTVNSRSSSILTVRMTVILWKWRAMVFNLRNLQLDFSWCHESIEGEEHIILLEVQRFVLSLNLYDRTCHSLNKHLLQRDGSLVINVR